MLSGDKAGPGDSGSPDSPNDLKRLKVLGEVRTESTPRSTASTRRA
jgi:hypothetical protein